MSKEQAHFPDRYIDEIRAETENNYFTPVLKEAFDVMPALSSICDVGCGNGVFSAALKTWGNYRLAGVDGSAYALQQAKEEGFDELHLIEDFSSSRLPIEDDSFDFVLSKDVLEHVLHADHLVGELARIVRPDGYALIHVPNHFPIIGRLRLLFHNKLDTFDYFPDSHRWDFPHIRFFTMKDLCLLFEQYGFEVVSDMNCHFFIAGRLGRFIPAFLKRYLCANYPDAWVEGYTVLFRKQYRKT